VTPRHSLLHAAAVDAAVDLLERIAVATVGELITKVGDPIARDAYVKLLTRLVELRDSEKGGMR